MMDDDGTIVGDDDRNSIWSFTTATSQDFKFKLKRKDINFAPIQNADIVELAHANDGYLYIRSTRNDEKYESILKKVNWNKNQFEVPSFPLENYDVIIVKFSGDYSRGIVVNDAPLMVELMDIGQKIVVDKENVFCMSAEIMKEDRMVTPVQLDHPKLSPEEKSAVESKIEKLVHRRFTAKSINAALRRSQLMQLFQMQLLI